MLQWSARIQIDGANRIDSTNIQHSAPNPPAQATAYEDQISQALGRIAGNAVGAVLLARINAAPFDLWIGPPLDRSNPITLHTGPGSGLSGVPIGNPPQLGTGVGAAEIVLMPVHPSAAATGMARGPDDVLAHELMHAVRGLFGHLTVQPDPSGAFGDIEEFFAILVENMFVSVRGSRWMRVRHSPRTPLRPGLTPAQVARATTGVMEMLRVTSEFVLDEPSPYTPHPRPPLAQQWAADFRDWIDIFRKAESAIAGPLTGMGIFFNPLRFMPNG